MAEYRIGTTYTVSTVRGWSDYFYDGSHFIWMAGTHDLLELDRSDGSRYTVSEFHDRLELLEATNV